MSLSVSFFTLGFAPPKDSLSATLSVVHCFESHQLRYNTLFDARTKTNMDIMGNERGKPDKQIYTHKMARKKGTQISFVFKMKR